MQCIKVSHLHRLNTSTDKISALKHALSQKIQFCILVGHWTWLSPAATLIYVHSPNGTLHVHRDARWVETCSQSRCFFSLHHIHIGTPDNDGCLGILMLKAHLSYECRLRHYINYREIGDCERASSYLLNPSIFLWFMSSLIQIEILW